MNIKQKILAAYEKMAESYDRMIDFKPHNAYYDRPNTLSMMENVEGKLILDAACGPGKYAEILLAKGANVVGFDVSPKMVELAKKRNGSQGEFYVHDMTTPLDQFEDQKYDFVLCALALHYIKDWHFVLDQFNKKLKPGGQLILSLEHPFFNYLYHKSDRYFDVEPVSAVWKGFGTPLEVNGYRRSLGYGLSAITDSGFYIDKIFEPRPTAEFENLDPKHFKELNEFPSFLCVRAVKRD
jgi:ubiquinone/menaquinone biosynthesis C-methylase UbiE